MAGHWTAGEQLISTGKVTTHEQETAAPRKGKHSAGA